ncbi:hypothetical protein H5410_050886 [Solanum commersonii]|uniref:Uncharacterized protein n=1 Tax=Solanum commersonii TaxID=4109 RepID=A0A9J5WWT4_SOLCO|nr:hypothetical protein H5410_050886 [Solanum commersonii]
MLTLSLGHQSSAKAEEWRRPTSSLGKVKSFFFKFPTKPSPNLRDNIPKSTILL